MTAIKISFINLKGGVGKTQLTIALAEFLVKEHNKKVLVVDLDPQTNATVMLIGDRKWKELNNAGKTLYQLFKDKIDGTNKFNILESIVKKTSNVDGGLDDLHLLPSSLDLIHIQDEIPTIPSRNPSVAPAKILQEAIQPIQENYDFILIDCPPNLGIITQNGLMVSDYYLIPTKADYISTYGIPQILDRVNKFNRLSNRNVNPLGVVITMYSGHHKRLHDEVIDLLKRQHPELKIFDNYIPFRQRIAETALYDDSTTYTLKQNM